MFILLSSIKSLIYNLCESILLFYFKTLIHPIWLKSKNKKIFPQNQWLNTFRFLFE